MDLRLHGKVAVVTGGAKGIGEAVSTVLHQNGAVVAIVDQDEASGKALAEKLRRSSNKLDGVAEEAEGPQTAFFIHADLTEELACKAVVEQVVASCKSIDVLVNNAGVNDGVGLDAGLDPFIVSLRRNLFHVYSLTHYALPYLKSAREGAIVNISSKVCETGQGGTSGYAAAKGAINGLTRDWAIDFAPYNVRVNTVSPAECLTPMYEKWIKAFDDSEQKQKAIESLIPLGNRMTTPTEIANMVVFLASPLSGHTTGQIIYVDGGYTHLDRACTQSVH